MQIDKRIKKRIEWIRLEIMLQLQCRMSLSRVKGGLGRWRLCACVRFWRHASQDFRALQLEEFFNFGTGKELTFGR